MQHSSLTGLIFVLTLLLTFCVALFARSRSSVEDKEDDLAGRRLNKWLVGLSAGTTGNSGFIVTGAVGLGYVGGVHWLFLPLSWLLGDLVFWAVFPPRMNDLARKSNATTLSELLTFGLSGKMAKAVSISVSLIVITSLTIYVSAQWLAGKKFLSGVFEFSDIVSLAIFALTIVLYTSIGGFRGSVYTDTLQAGIRLIGTVIAIVAVGWYALADKEMFARNIAGAGGEFLSAFPNSTFVSTAGFVLGFAFAAIGFGLGQPQIASRYFAGSSPKETQAAWWVYIGFVQFTWIAMTLFGILLRGVMPGIPDPETGLSVFFQQNLGAIAAGLIIADVYATIASTSNGVLVAITQSFQHDLVGSFFDMRTARKIPAAIVTVLIGLVTILLSLAIPGNVFSIVLAAITIVGAGLAGPVMIKVLGWRHTAASLLAAILVGIAAAYLWKSYGLGNAMNEVGIGLGASIATNFLFNRLVK